MPDNSGSQKGKGGKRQLFTRVKTARGRKPSSTRWLQRQLNDPYVKQAREDGYRSRAAYKLLEIDDKFHFLKKGKCVIDLGAAPGGWTQVAVERIKAGKTGGGIVIGIDLQEIEPIDGAIFFKQDFLEDEALTLLESALDGKKADIVLSDMAAASCGHTATDHIRIMDLCETAFYFAKDNLAPKGVFVAKILRGGTENKLLSMMNQHFDTVRHFKPPASRADSAEMYVIAEGFKG